MTSLPRIPIIRAIFWVVAVLLGICQTWFVRHTIFSDGISYIDISTAYLAGDWNNAVNPYWSPLYSWAIALGFLVLHPSPYWQVAVLHVVNFFAYLVSLLASELFLFELVRFRESAADAETDRLPLEVVYIAGYCAALFAGLSLIGVGYCSPDMIAMALMLGITVLIMRISRESASQGRCFVALGVLCGLFFLARTAFAPTFFVCLVVVTSLLYRKGLPTLKPAAIILGTFLVLVAPFVIAISRETGHFTIGEAGKLNYGWEIAGASRFAHWQGEPNDIGTPKHTTTLVSVDPKAYVFASRVAGTYSPWFNPAFWYEGIQPKVKIGSQVRVWLVNLTVICNLLVRSPVLISAIALLLFVGVRQWWREFSGYWPVLLPSLAAIGIYSIVYVEKRYIAANFLVIWMVMLISIRFRRGRLPQWVPAAVAGFCVLYTGAFVVRRQTQAVKISLHDLFHRGEEEGNFSFMMARKIRELGLQPSDRVAVIGAGVDADWARIDGLKIVAEVPLTYYRNEVPFNNTLNLSSADIKSFWASDRATQNRVLEAFRKAGVKLVIADASFSPKLANSWPPLLDPNQPRYPKPDPETGLRPNFRYLLLSPDKSFTPASARMYAEGH